MKEVSFNAEKFAELMKKRKFTDGKLAYVSGVSRTMIYYMRKGERTKVSAEIVAALAGPLGTSTQYLMDQTDDSSPIQKTMSTLTADIVAMVEKLPPSRQREYQELGRTLLEIEGRTDVETIYGELMERITRLAEIDGGEEALDRLLNHLGAASGRSPGPSMSRRGRRRGMKDEGESIDEPSQSDE